MFKPLPLLTALVLLLTVVGSSSTAQARTGPSVVPSAQVQTDYTTTTPTVVDNFGASWVLGVAPAGNQATLGNIAQDAGVRWSREDASWFRIQIPAAQCLADFDGTYCWKQLDDSINLNVQRNIQVLLVLDYPVAGASGNPGSPAYYLFAPTTGPGLDAWSAFVRAVVGRYKDRVHHYQIWNSINDPTVWQVVTPGSDVAVYAPLLQRSYTTIKGSDPTATVVLANTSESQFNALLSAGATSLFDAAALSNYAAYDNPGVPTPPIPEASSLITTHLQSMRDSVHKRAPGKQIWVSEYAWGTSPGAPQGVSEDEQAQYLIRSMLLQNAQPEIGTILWSFFHDITGGVYNPNYPQDNMGMLVKIDKVTPKLSFNAYKAMTTALAGASFQSLSNPSTASYLVEGFETGRAYAPNPSAGASGSLVQANGLGHTGAAAGLFSYSWSQPFGAYVFALPLENDPVYFIPGPGSPRRVRVWARLNSGITANLGLELIDVTNERCTASLGLVVDSDWKPFTAYLDAPPDKTTLLTSCTGGNGNHVLEPPLKVAGFTVYGWDQGTGGGAGSILLDDLTFDEGPTIFDLAYTKSGETIHALWSLVGTPTATVPMTGTSATIRRSTNVTTDVPVTGGTVSVPVDQHPLFLSALALPLPVCTPRPAVSVRTSKPAPGMLNVTVSVSAANNLLTSLTLQPQPNAIVDVDNLRDQTAAFNVPITSSIGSKTFVIRRSSAAAGATVKMVVGDRCGTPWNSFAGGGVDAFR